MNTPYMLLFAEEILSVCSTISNSPRKQYSKCIFLVSQYTENILERLVPESLTALTRTSEVFPLLGLCPSALFSLLVVVLPFPGFVSRNV